jgi:phospholipid/cholesterol/gamma-HCH transport system permease protein
MSNSTKSIVGPVQRVGELTIELIYKLGNVSVFFFNILRSLLTPILRPQLLITQLYSIGVKTLLIILVAGLFVGMVLGLQFYTNLVDFGAESQLGLLVALTLVRELGPVLTALLFAGRACSALTAEIGLMRATEQLDAIEMMAVDPMKRVIAPRYLAGFLSVPLLTAIFTVMGIFGGHFVGVTVLGGDPGIYWSAMQSGVDFYDDVLNGLFKSVVFGAVITLIAVHQGYMASPTSEGVSSATTRTVVMSSLLILGLDFLLTSLMFS